MYPNVYLEEAFTKEFDQYTESPLATTFYSAYESRAKFISLRRIHDFIMSANVYCDFSKKDINECWTSEEGIAISFKEQVIRSIIKSDTYTDFERGIFTDESKDEMFYRNFSFFTGNSFEKSSILSRELGRIYLGKQFIKTPFFLNHSFPSVATDSSLSQIKEMAHPCSGLVVIDKYLFKDTKKLKSKIPNLIHVIDWLLPKGFPKKFEVCIISENTESKLSGVISSRYKEIQNQFEDKISLKIYAPTRINEIEASDRFILTNYSIFSIPHPFDRPTTISCNFYPSHPECFSSDPLAKPQPGNMQVISGYRTWKSKLELAKEIINRTKEKIGTVQHIWKSDDSKHTIFSDLD